MSATVTVFCLLLLCSFPAWSETGFLDRSVTVQGATYHYQVYVPREYTPKKLWPVIVDLHGHGSQGDDGLRQTFRGIADAIRVNRSPYPAIVVFPQAQVGTRFSYPGMQEMVAAELDQ